MRVRPGLTALIAIATVAIGCSFAPPTVLPERAQASAQIDALLPEVWNVFRRKNPSIQLIWMASASEGWRFERHVSGAVIGRNASVLYAYTDQHGRCWHNSALIDQERPGGSFRRVQVLGEQTSNSFGLKNAYGYAIDCATVRGASVGYFGPSSAQARAGSSIGL